MNWCHRAFSADTPTQLESVLLKTVESLEMQVQELKKVILDEKGQHNRK